MLCVADRETRERDRLTEAEALTCRRPADASSHFPTIVIVDKHVVFGEGGISRKCHRVCTFHRYFESLELIEMSLTRLHCVCSVKKESRVVSGQPIGLAVGKE